MSWPLGVVRPEGNRGICLHCKHFEPDASECRIDKPGWPQVKPTDWCAQGWWNERAAKHWAINPIANIPAFR